MLTSGVEQGGSNKVLAGALVALLVAGAAVAGIVAIRSRSGPTVAASATVSPSSSATGSAAAHPGATAAAGGKPIMSPATALALARTWFVRRDAARFRNDDKALAGLETAAALAIDQAFTRQISCGCTPAKHQHKLGQVVVVVPAAPARAFLAQFVAAVAGTGQPAVYTVVFVPSGKAWKAALITFDDRYITAFLPPADRTRAGPTAADSRRELAAFGSYLQHWRIDGAAPAGASAWTGIAPATGQDWATQGQDSTNPSTGVTSHVSPTTADPVTYSFAVVGGSVVCGSMSATATNTIEGQLLYQDPARRNWGSGLAPGVYPTIVQRFDNEVCVINHGSATHEVTAFYGTQVSIHAPGFTA